MMTICQDVRICLRMLARNPGFTAVAVITLAIALGANTAVFSVLNGILLRALPYPEPDRLLDASILLPPAEGRPSRKQSLDDQALIAWQENARFVEGPAAYRMRSFALAGQGYPERLPGASVSVALFPLLRVLPAQGRTFLEEEQQVGRQQVVLLSHRLWRRRFQGDPRIVGESVILDGMPHVIVGVMPASFFFPSPDVELWIPLAVESPAPGVISAHYDPAVARLRDGASLDQAEAEAETFLSRRRDGVPQLVGPPQSGRIRLAPLRDEMVSAVRPALLAMSAAVGLVLLIACINLANLLLARSSARQKELAIRSAVGGSRGRLMRQLLTESVVLSLAGGLAGMLLAIWVHRLLPRFLPQDIPRMEQVQLDTGVFLFAFFLSGITGLAFGLLPALRSAGASLVAPLQGGVSEGRSDAPSRRILLVAEVASACVLLVGAGLLLRSFLRLTSIEQGYRSDRVLMATLALDPTRYGTPGRAEAFFDQLLHRVEGYAGVEAAGLVSFPPLTPGFTLTSLTVVGQPPARTMAIPQMTSPRYFQAMGLRLAEGRWLTEDDLAMRARAAVVNESFVRQYLSGRGTIGRRLEVGSASFEIVGVLKDVRLLGFDSIPKPELFTSYHQATAISGGGPERLTLAIRTSGDPAAMLPALRTLLRELDPELAPEDVKTMQAKLSASVAQPRFYALLLAVFAFMALMLAAAGVYGVFSFAVARQTRAIGVRRALGARERDILVMVLRKGFIWVFIGLAIGMAVAAGATRILSHLLFGITSRDPLSYLVAALLLLGVALLACYLPARRAIRVSPIEALRYDG